MTQVVLTPPAYFGDITIPQAPELETQITLELTTRYLQTLTQGGNPDAPHQLLMAVSDCLDGLEQTYDLSTDTQAWLYHQGMAYLLNLSDYFRQWPAQARNAVELFPNSEQLKCLAFVVGRQASRAK